MPHIKLWVWGKPEQGYSYYVYPGWVVRRTKKMPGPKVECQKCNDIIQSLYRHDFVKCLCGQIYVDGGGAYLRIGYYKPEDYKILEDEEDG